ncbi:DNA-binding transcriptional LysR family regulator [Bradyrhizobium sp. AZCC 1578]|uniref:LysR family transcriptional regulator n=1 Tax=Bradyrhizobium sp. AZCC 1578 TaxID=3117027 RepID=UPI002FEF3BC8
MAPWSGNYGNQHCPYGMEQMCAAFQGMAMTAEVLTESSADNACLNLEAATEHGSRQNQQSSRRGRVAEANWDLFRLFSSVARFGSVNRAARELGMSQPTLSRRLKELERHIGAPLFFRVSSGVKLTQEGEQLRLSAAAIVRSFELFQRDLSSRAGDRSFSIKISATEGLTKHWLLPRVNKLRALNDKISLEIFSTVLKQNLAASDLDFVIRMGHPGDNELVGRRVATVAFGLFASEAYLAEHPAPRSIADLDKHEIIGSSADFAGLQGERSGQMLLLTQFKAAGDCRASLKVSIANHLSAATAGLGLAFLAVPFALAEGLVRVLPQESSLMDLWLLRRRESDLRKLTGQVRRLLETEFAASRAWFLGQQRPRRPLQRIA